jgi:hypothetical protein
MFIYYLIAVLLLLGSYLHWARGWLRKELKQDIDKNVNDARDLQPVLEGLESIRSRIDASRRDEHISFAIFDKLLIYSPLYVAAGVGYFEEEGLSATFEVTGDDRAVAAAVRKGDHLFGACDPFMCVPNSPKAEQVEDDLLVLFPLIKRFGFLVFGRNNALNRLEHGEKVQIGAYEKGSTSYLAAQAFKRWLVDNMQNWPTLEGVPRASLDSKIVVNEIAVVDGALRNEQRIAETLGMLDFVVLWEPQVSLVLASKLNTLKSFGVVARSSEDNAPLFKTFRKQPEGASGRIEGNWTAWVPGENHQCLISAVVTRRATLRLRPALCHRVYRALARSTMHLHSVDWDLDQYVLNSVRTQITGASHINAQMLHRMVRGGLTGMELAAERGGLFPFVHGWPRGTAPPYREHLLACHSLWHENDDQTQPVWSLADYDRCFVRLEDLRNGTNAP